MSSNSSEQSTLSLREHSTPVLVEPIRHKQMLVLCPFPEEIAPAQRLKYEQYFDHWRKHGYAITVSPFMTMDLFQVVWKKGHWWAKIIGALRGMLRRLADIVRIGNYDIVYVFMWVTPLGPTWPEKIVRSRAKKLIYDVDDNVHIGQSLPEEDNPNPLLRFLKNPHKPIYLMHNADFVITSSPFLEAEAKKINKTSASVYITSSVDTNHFVPRGRRPSNPKVVIGWTGTFSSKPFIDMMAPALRKLSELRDFEFRIIVNFDYQMDGVDLKVVRFDKSREIADLNAFDIGVYPLPNDVWVLGKSGLKAIVYMAMGLPVVASAVGTTALLFDHGEIGFMVDNSDQQWVDALTRLIDDEALRARMGAAARRVAIENYSREAVCGQYLKVLESVSS